MIALGSDHAGFSLKEEIKKHLDETGVEYVDVGCYSPERFDYAISAQKACDKVVSGASARLQFFVAEQVLAFLWQQIRLRVFVLAVAAIISAQNIQGFIMMQTLFVWERELSGQVLQSNLLTFSLIQNLRAAGTKIVLTK